jgi:hypothetical protein
VVIVTSLLGAAAAWVVAPPKTDRLTSLEITPRLSTDPSHPAIDATPRATDPGARDSRIEPTVPTHRVEVPEPTGDAARPGAAEAALGRAPCEPYSLALGGDATAPVGAMAASPDGTRIAVGMAERQQLFVLDALEPGTTVPQPIVTDNGVRQLAWSRDGSRLFVGQKQGDAELVVSGSSPSLEPEPCPGHAKVISAAAFSGDGERLVTADDGGLVIMRDAKTCKPVDERELGGPVHAVREPLSNVWLIAGSGGRLMRWRGPSRTPEMLSSGGPSLNDLALLGSDGRVVSVGQRLRAWDATGRELFEPVPLRPASQWVFVGEEGDGGALALAVGRRDAQLWQTAPGGPRLLARWEPTEATITGAAAFPDLHALLIVTSDGVVHWLSRDAAAIEPSWSLDAGLAEGGPIVLDPRERYFAVGDRAGRVTIVRPPRDRTQAPRCPLNDVR